jgi:hypothetical protein
MLTFEFCTQIVESYKKHCFTIYEDFSKTPIMEVGGFCEVKTVKTGAV